MSDKKQKEKEEIIPRPPVVAVMGHIDHGKSTLLDSIRKTNIVGTEAGGITQKMSAYEVEYLTENKKEKITFLDTPGHEAFKAMRTKGARVADLAVLVVAADDGVKPQTIEALKCIRDAKLPYVVAINKIDKPEANIEKTKNGLAENEIYLEGYGGNIPYVEISAKTGKNITELLEIISLSAQLENLFGNRESPAEGVVLESNLDTKKGITATLIIKNGILRTGLFVSAGNAWAPVRFMENFRGEKIEEITFSSPVKVTGWNQAPSVGTIFKTYTSKKEAEASTLNLKEIDNKKTASSLTGENEEENSQSVVIPIIIKADTQGGLDAIKHEIGKLKSDKVQFKIVSSGIGIISEKDIKNANLETKPIILGFDTKIDSSAKNLADREGVVIKIFDIIYKMTEWLKNDLTNLLPKIETEEVTGKIQIIKIFGEQKDKQIIGGKVMEGAIELGGMFKINRRDNIVGTGKVKELQHKKADIREVKEGNEFGALVESKIPVSQGDKLEFYKIAKKPVQI